MDSKPPLGLPPGSVRAALAILVTVSFCFLVVMGKAVPDNLDRLVELAFVGYGLVRAAQWQAPTDPPPSPAPVAAAPAPAPAPAETTTPDPTAS